MFLVLCGLLCATVCVLSDAPQHRDRTPPSPPQPPPQPALEHERAHRFEDTAEGPALPPLGAVIERNGSFEDEAAHGGTTSSLLTKDIFIHNMTCPALESLDFLRHFLHNETAVQILEKEWPCELRVYWHELQGLVTVVQFLFKYGTIGLIISGILVNIYSLFVLSTPPISKCNISVYLRALAISDIGALIFNVSVGVLRARSETVSNFYLNHGWMCLLHKILLSVFFYYSSWLVVTFTFERLLMIKNPFKIHTWNNDKPAKIAVMILAVVTLSMSLIKSFTTPGFEKDNMYGYQPCQSNETVKIGISQVPFTFINIILPAILIIIANICLLLQIRRSAQDRNNLAVDDQSNNFKITRMLIIISVIYVLLYLPLGITSSTELYFRNQKSRMEDIKWRKKMLLLREIRGLCFFIYLLNYVNNFFLYCLSGDIFRQTVKVCLPTYLRKICHCFFPNAPKSRNPSRISPSQAPTTLQRTGVATLSQSKQSSVIPEHGYQNEVFSIAEETT